MGIGLCSAGTSSGFNPLAPPFTATLLVWQVKGNLDSVLLLLILFFSTLHIVFHSMAIIAHEFINIHIKGPRFKVLLVCDPNSQHSLSLDRHMYLDTAARLYPSIQVSSWRRESPTTLATS